MKKPSPDAVSEPERRSFLKKVAAALAAAGFLEATTQAQATSKKVANYQDHPNDGHHCSGCRNFRPPNSCRIVSGTISPNGWCKFYSSKG